jgi:ankyrin repeat protein
LEEIVSRPLGTKEPDFYFDGKVSGSGTFHNASEALIIAVHRDYESLVRLLVDFGADVNYRRCELPLSNNECNPSVHTALQAAAAIGNEAIIRFLVQRGANVNNEDACNPCNPCSCRTPLYYAVCRSYEANVSFLLNTAPMSTSQTTPALVCFTWQ